MNPRGTVFDGLSPDDVRSAPFPHVLKSAALDPAYYAELDAAFPPLDVIAGDRPLGNNRLFLLSATAAVDMPQLAPVWQAFLRDHFTADAFRQAMAVLAPALHAAYPDLTERLGRPLAEAKLAPRRSGLAADISFDVQFGVNSPVTEVSRVRGAHVDRPDKLFNALFYMRPEHDRTLGGDLDLFCFRAAPRYRGVEIDDAAVEPVARVDYRPNTLLLFMNSPTTIHGVTPRGVTDVPRRYVNFLAQARRPLFDLSYAQDS